MTKCASAIMDGWRWEPFRFGLGACCDGRMDGRMGGALLPPKTPLFLRTDEITPTRETPSLPMESRNHI